MVGVYLNTLTPLDVSIENLPCATSTVSPLLLNFQRKLCAGGSASTLHAMFNDSPLDAPTTTILSSLHTGATEKYTRVLTRCVKSSLYNYSSRSFSRKVSRRVSISGDSIAIFPGIFPIPQLQSCLTERYSKGEDIWLVDLVSSGSGLSRKFPNQRVSFIRKDSFQFLPGFIHLYILYSFRSSVSYRFEEGAFSISTVSIVKGIRRTKLHPSRRTFNSLPRVDGWERLKRK